MTPRLSRSAAAIAAGLFLVAALGRAAGGPSGTGTPAEGVTPQTINGFRLVPLLVKAELIRAGGPARDQIKAVDDPQFVPPEQATWVAADTPVIGLELNGETRAYPVHLMERHQIVNDALAGVPIAVSYDPLAGTPRAFRRSVAGKNLHFGVSGLVYNACSLMYDRETQSLWSQFTGQAIAGPLSGTHLDRIRVRQEPRDLWLGRAPTSSVLVRPDPMGIDYRYSPYTAYWLQEEIPFPVAAKDPRFHSKELVLGVVMKGKARAYLGSLLTAAGGRVTDFFQGKKIQILYDSEDAVMQWEVPKGIEVTEAYWFAWKAFYPDTEVWNDPKVKAPKP
jgi:Protein of unknown function (DUF3179)